MRRNVYFKRCKEYNHEPGRGGRTMTVKQFLAACQNEEIVESCGWAHPAILRSTGIIWENDKKVILPSEIDQLPGNATHVVWYEREYYVPTESLPFDAESFAWDSDSESVDDTEE